MYKNNHMVYKDTCIQNKQIVTVKSELHVGLYVMQCTCQKRLSSPCHLSQN